MSPGHVYSTGRRVLLVGGTSEIGLAIVRELQGQAPREVALLGREELTLASAATALRASGVERVVTIGGLHAERTDAHEQLLDEAFAQLGGADIAILAVGALGERGTLTPDQQAAVELLRVNAVGASSLLLGCARRMRAAGSGAIVVLSSVAAERPRQANALYGASKAALDALARGLGDELADEGVRVLVVRPGFVHTRMTDGLAPAPFATTPQVVAVAVREGLDSGAQVVWAPRALRAVMLVMRLLPRPIFRRLKQ